MAYDQFLADRIKQVLEEKNIVFSEKKMFGGAAFMVDEKMCLGVIKENMMARINPDFYAEARSLNGCVEMDFSGRPMNGFVFIEPIGMEMDEDLEFWVQKCLDYNPLAKASKKKSKK
jgi:hypothetical protein